MKVLKSGTFDLLHSGHIYTFHVAKSFGDYLIVNVAPDKRIRNKKGKGRPIMSERERCYIVKNLKCVDEVVCVPDEAGLSVQDYEQKVLRSVKPDIFVRDSYDRNVAKFCQTHDIKLVIVPEIEGLDKMHTTDIINKIKDNDQSNKNRN